MHDSTIPRLYKHQEEAVEFILKRGGSGALFMDMGTGKTRTALEILRELRRKEPDLRMLVVAPLSLLEAAWGEDIKRFTEFQFWNVRENGFPEEAKVRSLAQVCLINYESLLSKAYLDGIKRLVRGPWLCVADESSRAKNHASKTAKTLLALRDRFKYRIVMSGTPAPNSEMEYWAQLEFVRPGILHPSFYGFRNTWFHLENKYTGRVQQGSFMTRFQAQDAFRKGWGYKITEAKRRDLLARIAPFCHRRRKEECLDLPEETDEVRFVELAPGQHRVYEEMKRHLVAEIQGRQIAAQVALTKIMKLRQITSGFIYNEFGEAFEVKPEICNRFTGDPPIVREFDNPKLAELFDVIEEAGDQPIIIWIQFHWEQIKLCHELHKRFGEDRVVTLSALTKDKDESIRAFRDGRARFLVAHPRSAAHGLTFVNCSLEVFFSLDWSWEAYEQGRARIHRAGQTKKCTYVHLVAKDTIDETLLQCLKRKADAQEVLGEIFRRGKIASS